jgi:hypothetical protein
MSNRCQSQQNILDNDKRKLVKAETRRDNHRARYPKESSKLRRLNDRIVQWEGTIKISQRHLDDCQNGS